jgi:hypothetical protein
MRPAIYGRNRNLIYEFQPNMRRQFFEYGPQPFFNVQSFGEHNYYPTPGGFSPYLQGYGGMMLTGNNGNNHVMYNGGGKQQIAAESIFQNPLQPPEDGLTGGGGNQAYPGTPFPYMHPYPKQAYVHKPPSGFQSVMNSFKTQDGSLDINKMINTAGQMMNAVTQVSSMVKGLGGIFKA